MLERSSVFAIDRLSYAELTELTGTLQIHGVDEVEHLPLRARERCSEILRAAASRWSEDCV